MHGRDADNLSNLYVYTHNSPVQYIGPYSRVAPSDKGDWLAVGRRVTSMNIYSWSGGVSMKESQVVMTTIGQSAGTTCQSNERIHRCARLTHALILYRYIHTQCQLCTQ